MHCESEDEKQRIKYELYKAITDRVEAVGVVLSYHG